MGLGVSSPKTASMVTIFSIRWVCGSTYNKWSELGPGPYNWYGHTPFMTYKHIFRLLDYQTYVLRRYISGVLSKHFNHLPEKNNLITTNKNHLVGWAWVSSACLHLNTALRHKMNRLEPPSTLTYPTVKITCPCKAKRKSSTQKCLFFQRVRPMFFFWGAF